MNQPEIVVQCTLCGAFSKTASNHPEQTLKCYACGEEFDLKKGAEQCQENISASQHPTIDTKVAPPDAATKIIKKDPSQISSIAQTILTNPIANDPNEPNNNSVPTSFESQMAAADAATIIDQDSPTHPPSPGVEKTVILSSEEKPHPQTVSVPSKNKNTEDLTPTQVDAGHVSQDRIKTILSPPSTNKEASQADTIQKHKKTEVAQNDSVLFNLFSAGNSNEKASGSMFFSNSIRKEKYSYVRDLAAGGMGKVDLIKDNDLNRNVARKSMLGDLVEDPKFLERFIEEAQATGQLEHPNIVPIHDMGLDQEGQLYFTMKFIKGKTLEEILKELKVQDPITTKKYSITYLLQLFIQICNAIGFAHSKGVIHRDLKPANIMLGGFGEVVVMDWGLAKIMDSEVADFNRNSVETLRGTSGNKTLSGSIIGTPAYMPPEQARGEIEKLDQTSDIYSLGAILYEILSLRPPFYGRDIAEILTAVIQGKITPPEN